MSNLFYAEIIEQAMKKAQAEATKAKQSLHPLHFLKALVESTGSDSHKLVGKYLTSINEKLASLPKSGAGEMSLELKQWVNLAKSNTLIHNREMVGENDFIETMGEFFNLKTPNNTSIPTFNQLVKKKEEEAKNEYLSRVDSTQVLLANEELLTQLMENLGRADFNNIVISGEKGVGKSSLVKKLAQKIKEGVVPSNLKNKSIYELKTSMITLNIHDPREVSARMIKVVSFIKEKPENRILYIPNFELCLKNTLLLDNIKHAILVENINVILEVNRDSLDVLKRDLQLKGEFNYVLVKEPSIEESILILETIAPSYELSKGVHLSKEVLQTVVEQSAKHIAGEFLPLKAIMVLDKACAKFKLEQELPGAEEAQLQDKITQLETSLKYQEDDNKQKQVTSLKAQAEKLTQIRVEKVNRLLQIPALQHEVDKQGENKEAALKELAELRSQCSLDKMDVCEVISLLTDIPKEKIAQSRQDNILKVKETLAQRVFGQDEAISSIGDTLMTSYAGLSAEQKPLGSFLLLGPSGVGKTEIAKSLAEILFGNEKSVIRFDLSEYSEKHSVAKLIGAPAGYAGYEDGGVLTEAIRKNPYSVILFDEVEKGHPDFSNILLQVLDDGRLTDNKGRTVYFNNAVIFLTSNLKEPTEYFRPEMIGRFSDVIRFKPLDLKVMPLLVNKELKNLNKRLLKQNLKVELSPDLVDYLSTTGHSTLYGARPMVRLFNNAVGKPLAQLILAGKLTSGSVKAELLEDKTVKFNSTK